MRQDTRHPFDDAAAVWHMGAPKQTQSQCPPLAVNGEVRLGVVLQGHERDASLARGGDGVVAEFQGGYLSLPAECEDRCNLAGMEMSLCMRVRDFGGAWDTPLVGKYGDVEAVSYLLGSVGGVTPSLSGQSARRKQQAFFHEGQDSSSRAQAEPPAPFLTFTWGGNLPEETVEWLSEYPYNTPALVQEAHQGVLRVGAPMARDWATDWHDVIVRFTGPKLQLFIDGVLLDEEYPIGTLRQNTVPFLIGATMHHGAVVSGFKGQIDHVALWSRALDDDEIQTLSGGAVTAAESEARLLGSRHPVRLHWRPRGYNKKIGDCFPYFDGEKLHVFYLTIRRSSHSKWQGGHGGLQVEHMTTKDLLHWDFHPIAVPISDQWEGWHGTGSCILHEGVYYLYFPTLTCMPKSHPGGIQLAISSDGIHFEKQEPRPLVEGGDNDVFVDASGRFHLITYTEKQGVEQTELAHFVSSDLRQWQKQDGPLLTNDDPRNHLYCPNYFKWNDWYYIVAGSRSTVWKSKHPFGPWTMQRPSTPESSYVPRSAAFPGNRRIQIGWVSDTPGSWGGDIVIRELVQDDEGNLGVKFPQELMPPTTEPVRPALTSLTSAVCVDSGAVECKSTEGMEIAAMENVPRNARITLRVTHKSGSGRFGVCLRGSGEYDDGCELQFDMKNARAQFGRPDDGLPGIASPVQITEVNETNRPFALEIVAEDQIVHAAIDDRRALAVRNVSEGNRLFFFSQGCEVAFESIRICPLN